MPRDGVSPTHVLSIVSIVSIAGLALVASGWATSSAAQSADSLRPLIAARYPEVRWVSADTVERWMGESRPLVLLDSRAEAEFAVSHLRGARRVDPDHPRLEALQLPSDARVVVYCSVGWRSGDIADRIRRAGHREVFNLEGGIFAWANAGRPVFRGERRVRAVHPYDETWGRLLDARLHAHRP